MARANNADGCVCHRPHSVWSEEKAHLAVDHGMLRFDLSDACRWCDATATVARILTRIQLQLFDAILIQDIQTFDETRVGDLLERMSTDALIVKDAMARSVINFLEGLIKLSVALGFMTWASPILTGILLTCLPILVLISVPMSRALKSVARQLSEAKAAGTSIAQEMISSVRTVRAFASESLARKLISNFLVGPQVEEHRKAPLLCMLAGLFICVLMLTVFGVLSITIWLGFLAVLDDQLDPGVLLSFFLYASFAVGCTMGLLAATASLMSSLGAVLRITAILDQEPVIPICDMNALRPSTIKGRIEFKSVHFAYPSRPLVPILRNFSLLIPANKATALVGMSGGGKSTVLSVLERFYDVAGGQVVLDYHDITTLDPCWLRQRIAYVQQEPVLFSCSIAENINFSRRAAKEANAFKFIENMSDGFETEVGERGMLLSGGQKQRIAIARAIVSNPRILLLDEATSALDSESEALVQQALDRLMISRTVVAIAHRLKTIVNMDQISLLSRGEVVDSGSHADLLQRCAAYQQLVRASTH
ncbi:hypothetical protein AURANDRAFT_59622 [Aureococcus anophagefferens]|uniref:ABC transporter n=1 Tax=Aureococcus anophagefferens TaxID=44056 RepID=F0YMX7_AURAN|nr:hypothetical protein AURANDRAFT_59622 [Aureococcus anophagefferens]EGB03544.1 hypothetical protein AURANDRAFT_59622 [Aureococcus anophagefferens]|eukprot:XP_009041759.1 hypothetical protein AURANDRAFT_59622 [Aureococcus anophagefferens]